MSQRRDTNSCPDGYYRVLNTSELRELLQDEEKMDQIVRLNDKFQELQVDREVLLTSNRGLAEESLARRPHLQDGKRQLAAKYEELARLTTACREKQSRLEAHTDKHSPKTAQSLLLEDVARAEEESEDLLERFMEGRVPLEGFLDSFQSSRKVYHIRRAQAEKIQEFTRPEPKHKRPAEGEEGGGQRERENGECKKGEILYPLEPPRPNGISTAQGPPRVFQLRYGLTPAILVPHFPLPTSSSSSSIPTHAISLSPAASLPLSTDSRSGQGQASGPTSPTTTAAAIMSAVAAPHPCPGKAVGLRVIGQIPGWPAPNRPIRLQQLYRPSPHQTEPPYR
ncbi:vacuolar protein sorting-associated protein 37D [Engraulis encrasicolus]|uniref:vacuolar protein sorting-associated protein 37D n=1 Tax=Engraulis encrasicolus TaxID=184585 RepID=UPI002FD5367C